MKKQILSLASVLLALAGNAQPVIDKLYDFQPGSIFTYKLLPTGVNIDTNTIATVGAGVTWDFSGLTLDNTIRTDSIKSLAGSSFPASFPGASYVFREHTGLQQYYRKGNDTVLYMGNDYGGSPSLFSPHAPTIVLPATWAAGGNNNYGPVNVNAAGNAWVYTGRYNAWGTLKLPGGATYQNVGLYIVKGGNTAQTYSDYMWAVPGRAQPLLRLQFQQTPSASRVYHSYFPLSALSPNSVGSVSTDAKELLLSPNPAKDRLYFSGLANPVSLRITDLAGRQMKSISWEKGSPSVDVRGLPAGLYLLQLNTEKESRVQLFQVAE